MQEDLTSKEKEILFERKLVAEYLKYGSVDEVYKAHDYNLPISYAGFQRLLDRWGIVKAAGPNTRLSEALSFLSVLVDEEIPLERLYRAVPPSFKTSMGTLHRILTYIRTETVRRVGTALVISPTENPNLVLVGNDISTPRLNLGKPFGSISLPMGYSKRTESAQTAILRVLQQEVFTKEAIDRSLDFQRLIGSPEVFMYLDIADVRVSVYHFVLPREISLVNFSSFKITNHRFMSLAELVKADRRSNFRAGIKEIGIGYQQHLVNKHFGVEPTHPIWEKARLNRELALAYAYLEKIVA